MKQTEQKGRAVALLPIGVFLIFFLGTGIVTGDFYAMPAIVAFLIALAVAFVQNPKLSFNDKIKMITVGVGNENVITMCLIFLCAGGFSGAVTAAGGVESTVNFGLSILPSDVAIVGLFMIGCFISVSMGTSMGTIAALAPIAVGISEKTGYAMALCIGAVVCGAMFGDNLSMISDTTIAAVKTQGCEMKDKFKANFLIVLPAAILTILIFLVITQGSEYNVSGNLNYNLWQIVPYVLVLTGALIGINVFVVLIGGTIVSLIVGVLTGTLAVGEIFTAIGGGVIDERSIGGITGMYDITVISIVVACIVSLVKEYGGIQFILNLIKSRISSKKGAEFGIAGLAFMIDVCTANNTVAIVMAGPFAREICEEFGIAPKRSASLLDIFTSVGQGLIPYGAQLLSAATLTRLTPFEIMPYLYYPILMAVSAICFIVLKKEKREKESKMNLLYKSTRNAEKMVTASEAILKGLADDGGLFVPVSIPKLDVDMNSLKDMSYQETAYTVMKQFFTDFTEEELKECIAKAYDSKFDTEEIAPLVKVDGTYFLELFHGKTIAFKDMALSILPHLLTTSAKKNNVKNEIVILTATSGDTGKAALAGFADVEGTRIIVFYPKNGVSKVQELQMVTQKGNNTSVVAIHGNFDNAQSGVKAIFENKELAKELDTAGYQFSSANSINIGRLVPQVVYYVYAYAKLLQNEEIAEGEEIDVVVPTGNFGNILAAYYAKKMGVPIAKLVCASNENKVLFDFFNTGVYNKNREFILTTSPSMDILISSNLERLIYLIAGEDAQKNKELMSALKADGVYEITEEMKDKLSDFVAGYATEEQVKTMISDTYEKTGYIMDTHTAVAAHVCKEYRRESKTARKAVIASTASPYKFIRSVMSAIDDKYNEVPELDLIDSLERLSNVKIPEAIEEIRSAEILHTRECEADKMEEMVKTILKK